MHISFEKLKELRFSLHAIVAVGCILLILLTIGMLLAAFGVYYFYSYDAVTGEPETAFEPNDFSTSEIRKVEELLKLRSERFAGSSTPSFLRAFR